MRARPLTDTDRRAILGWHYTGRDATYDPGADGATLDDGFVALEGDDGALVGYACLGGEARVAGLDAVDGVVDVGVGLRPDLVGGGWGPALTAAALGLVRDRHPDATHARAVVLDWNERSQRTLVRAGFRRTGEHVTPAGVRFVVLQRSLG